MDVGRTTHGARVRAASSTGAPRRRRRAWLVAVATTLTGVVAGPAVALGPTAAGATGPAAHPRIALASPGSVAHASQSTNWSGYDQGALEKGTTFSSIGATWTVPTATQHTPGQAEDSATWIGIGGGCMDTSCSATDPTLVQAGTEQDVSAGGVASYSAWWEIIPLPSVAAAITVHAGDVVHGAISSLLPGLWRISLTDLSDGQGFTQTVPYLSTELSAEWVEETPTLIGTSGAGLAALPDLGTVSFRDATVNGHGAGLVPAEQIQLVDASGTVIARPSAPDTTGSAFDDCTFATSCPAP